MAHMKNRRIVLAARPAGETTDTESGFISTAAHPEQEGYHLRS